MRTGINQGLYEQSTIQLNPIGTTFQTNNGKTFRYALVGAAALVTGDLLQEAAQDTQFENMAVLAAAVGATSVTVTNGTTTITANQFVGGTVGVYTAGGTAICEEYEIIGHTTGTSGAAITLYLDEPIRVAWTTSAKVNMKRSIWSGVIQYPITTQTGVPAGAAVYQLAAAGYGWVQTHGQTTMLSDNSTFAVGSAVSPSLSVAGAIGVNVAGTTHTNVGVVRQAKASAKGISTFLMID